MYRLAESDFLFNVALSRRLL